MALERETRMADGRPPGTGPENTPGVGSPSSSQNPENRPPIDRLGRGIGATDEQLDALAARIGSMPNEQRRDWLKSIFQNPTQFTSERLSNVPTRTPLYRIDRHGNRVEVLPVSGGAEDDIGPGREEGPDINDPSDINYGRADMAEENRRRMAEFARRGLTPEQIQEYQQAAMQGMDRGEESFYNMYQELETYKKRGDFHRIRERVDNILATLDIDEAGEAPGINEMLQYMNIVFAEPQYEAFRSEITNWIEARQITHSVAFAAKYLKCEQWSGGLNNLRGRHLNALMAGKAEKKASAILEEPAEIREGGKVIGYGAAGENYRRKAGENAVSEDKLEAILANWGGDNGQYEITKSGTNPWTLLKRYELVDEMWDDHEAGGDFLGIDGASKLAGLVDFPEKGEFYDENGGFKKDEYDAAVTKFSQENKDRLKAAGELAKEKYRKLFLYGMNLMIKDDPLDKKYSAFRAVNMLYNDQEKGTDPKKKDLFVDLSGKQIVSKNIQTALQSKQALKNFQDTIQEGNMTEEQKVILENLSHRNSLNISKLSEQEKQKIQDLNLSDISEATLTDIEKAFVQLNRAFVIAEKMHHASGYSAISDGLVWKHNAIIPDEIKGSADLGYLNRPGQAIVIDPVIEWYDDETRDSDPARAPGENQIFSGKKVTLHLAVDMLPESPDDSDEVKRRKRILRKLAGEKSGEIAKAWSHAYREFYIKYSDQINYQDSKSGRGARDKKKLHYKPADYWDPGELNNGKFTELRKYGYVNTLSNQQFFGLGSNEQLAGGWDTYFNRIKYNGSRWAAMEKLQSMFDKAGPRLLYDTHSIQGPENLAKTLDDFMKASLALTEMVEFEHDHQTAETEVTEYIQTLAKGLLEFRTNDRIADKYHLEKLNYNEIDQLTRMLAFKHLAGHHDVDELRAQKLGTGVNYLARASWHSVDKKKGIWGVVIGFIKEFGDQLGKATDFSKAA